MSKVILPLPPYSVSCRLPGRLYYARKHICNITQAELADHTEIDPSVISMYESGKREPSLKNLVKIARYLCVSTDYLVGLDERPIRALSADNVVKYNKLSPRGLSMLKDCMEVIYKHGL